MTITVTLTDDEYELMETYAKCRIIPIEELMKKALLEKIVDDYEMATEIKEALDDYNKNHKSYSLEEVKKMFQI